MLQHVLFFLLWVNSVLLHGCTTFCYPSNSLWTFGLSLPIGYCQQCYEHLYLKFLFAYLFSVLMDKYVGGELLGYLVLYVLLFEEMPNCFPEQL